MRHVTRAVLLTWAIAIGCAVCGAQGIRSTSPRSTNFSNFSNSSNRSAGPVNRPTFSPYLNLLRGGSPVLNYYGLVRPELDLRSSQMQLRGSFGRLTEQLERQRSVSRLQKTGHGVRFLSDLRGGSDSLEQALSGRRSGQSTKAPFGLGSTGHGAFFGNPGLYFPNPSNR